MPFLAAKFARKIELSKAAYFGWLLCWWALEASGFSIAVQLYAVIAVSLLVTSGLYHFMQWHICRDTRFMRAMRRLGYKTHISRTGIFFWLQQVMDRV